MKKLGYVLCLTLGLALGVAGMANFRADPPPVWAGNDRHDDYIMATGTIVLGTIPTNVPGNVVGRQKGGQIGAGGPNVPGGPAGTQPLVTTFNTPNIADVIWLLDYRAGKLLGTVVDKNLGKIIGWEEVDLVQEFNIPPKQNVHFMMTTGSTVNGNTSLYLAEVNTGRFGVYSLGPRFGQPGVIINRHDAKFFRQPAQGQ